MSADNTSVSDLQRELDKFMRNRIGGVSMAWVDPHGSAVFHSGVHSIKDPHPITSESIFDIASVTKVFTAILLVESERLGKLSRFDSASKYLLPPDDVDQQTLSPITLLSLVTHTSGLPRIPFNIGKDVDNDNDPFSAFDRSLLISALRMHGRTAKVGEKASYSNFGLAILGEAIGEAWGTTYEEAVNTHILNRLGMHSTAVAKAGCPLPPQVVPPHSNGQILPSWTFQCFASAGGLRSTSEDMGKFLRACLDKEGLLRSAFEATAVPHIVCDEVGGYMGMGWFLTDDSKEFTVWHNGSTNGSHSFLAINKQSGVGLMLMANSDTPLEPIGFEFIEAKRIWK